MTMPSLDDILDEAADAVELDLSGSVDFDDVPNGTYVAKLTKAEPGKSKADNPVLKWYFDVAAVLSVDNDEPAPAVGSKLPIITSNLDGKAAWKTKKIIKALGFTVDASSSAKVKFSPSAAIGRTLQVVVQQQKDNAEYQELTGFAPYTGTVSDETSLSSDDVADLSSLS